MFSLEDLKRIGLADDVESFQRLLVDAVERLGYGLASGVMVRGRFGTASAVVRPFGNTPAAFVEASRTVDIAARDPVLTDLLRRPGLVTYEQRTYSARGAADLWDWQAQYGYRAGMAVSLHDPSVGEVFSFGVDGDKVSSNPAERLRLEAGLRLLSAHAQAAAQRLFFPAAYQDPASLTATELEALKWASDGVSVWVVGDKLCVSAMRAEGLLDSARRKLGAATHAGAVLRAIEGGKISG